MGIFYGQISKKEILQDKFYEKTRSFAPKTISEDRLEEIKFEVEQYKERMLNTDGKTISQIELDKKNLVFNAFAYLTDYFNGLNYSSTENIIFIILLIDPELRMLEIYFEESNKDVIKKRIREEFYFYNVNFLNREKVYNNYFNVIDDPFADYDKSRTRK